jgi:hypothetical protein
MNVSFRPLLLASAALLAPQISSATILAGYNAFVQGNAGGSATETAPGITATYSGTTTSALGSNDGTYGPTLPVTGGGRNNGTAIISGAVSAPVNFVISVTNNTGSTMTLSSLLFDATTRDLAGQRMSITYTITNPLDNGGGSELIVDSGYTNVQDFGDFTFNIGKVLNNSGIFTATFAFVSSGNPNGTADLYIDNIALVPEPGSLLALGALMGGGVFFRSRRRRA